MIQQIDLANRHGVVMSNDGRVVIMRPPPQRLGGGEALAFAAWIIACADPTNEHTEAVIAQVRALQEGRAPYQGEAPANVTLGDPRQPVQPGATVIRNDRPGAAPPSMIAQPSPHAVVTGRGPGVYVHPAPAGHPPTSAVPVAPAAVPGVAPVQGVPSQPGVYIQGAPQQPQQQPPHVYGAPAQQAPPPAATGPVYIPPPSAAAPPAPSAGVQPRPAPAVVEPPQPTTAPPRVASQRTEAQRSEPTEATFAESAAEPPPWKQEAEPPPQ